MTKNLSKNYNNIYKYKRARDQVLEQIKNNQPRMNYINNKTKPEE